MADLETLKLVSDLVVGDSVADYGVIASITPFGQTMLDVTRVGDPTTDSWPVSALVKVRTPAPTFTITATWTTHDPERAARWGSPTITLLQIQLGADSVTLGPVQQQ